MTAKADRFRISMDPYWFSSLDPVQNQCDSTTLLLIPVYCIPSAYRTAKYGYIIFDSVQIAKRSPAMRAWKPDAKTCVASMTDGDFYSSEKSHIMPKVEPTGSVSDPDAIRSVDPYPDSESGIRIRL
jgi:hypothetical protein